MFQQKSCRTKMLRFLGACDYFLNELELVQKNVPNCQILLDDILMLCERSKVSIRDNFIAYGVAFNCDTNFWNFNFESGIKSGEIVHPDIFQFLNTTKLPTGLIKISKISTNVHFDEFCFLGVFTEELKQGTLQFHTLHFVLSNQDMNKLNVDWESFSYLFSKLTRQNAVFLTNVIRMFCAGFH